MRHIRVFEEHNVIDNSKVFKSIINWKFINFIESLMTKYEDDDYTFDLSVAVRQNYRDYSGKQYREFEIWYYPNTYINKYESTAKFYGIDPIYINNETLQLMYNENGLFYSFRFELPKDDPIRRYVDDIVIEKKWKIRDEIYKKITEKFKVEMVGRYSTGFVLKLF